MRASASLLVPLRKLEAVKAGGGKKKQTSNKKVYLHSMFLPWDAADGQI